MKSGGTRKLSLTTLIPIAIFAIFYLFYKAPSRHFGFLSHNKASETVSSHNQPECNVVRVIDGDTFVCRFSDGKEEHIRLIGVDAPELRRNQKGEKDSERRGQDISTILAQGKKASNFTKSYLKPGIPVKLELDVELRDRYQRLLAYVYLPDGTFFNALLVQEGYAQIMTVPPNVRYQDLFLKLQREARENNRGLWKEYAH
jgi:micrococcal nuclease